MTAAIEGGEWSAARPGRTLPPGKTRYPFYRRLGGPQGRSGRAEKSRPHRDVIPDRPARSSVAIPTEPPGPQYKVRVLLFPTINLLCFGIITFRNMWAVSNMVVLCHSLMSCFQGTLFR